MKAEKINVKGCDCISLQMDCGTEVACLNAGYADGLIVQMLKCLNDEQRKEIFYHFCLHCGCIDEGFPGCQCWNDE